jgi:transcriptional regulator with XRE-family HTH domain
MAQAPLSRLLGNRLRELRESRGLVLKEVERLSGISATHISEIERGRTSPTISVLKRIASALEAPASYLLELPPVNQLRVVTPHERKVLRDDDQKVLLQRLSEPWGGGELIFHHLRLEPGAVFPGEAPPSEDIVFVLKGSIGIRIGQDWKHLGEGDTLHLRTREALRVTNGETRSAELFWATRPGSHV